MPRLYAREYTPRLYPELAVKPRSGPPVPRARWRPGRRCAPRRRRRRPRRRCRPPAPSPGPGAARPGRSPAAIAGSRLISVPNAAVVSRRRASSSRLNGTTGSSTARPSPIAAAPRSGARTPTGRRPAVATIAGHRHRDGEALEPGTLVADPLGQQDVRRPADRRGQRERRRRPGRRRRATARSAAARPTAASAGHTLVPAGRAPPRPRAGRGTPARWPCPAAAGRPRP